MLYWYIIVVMIVVSIVHVVFREWGVLLDPLIFCIWHFYNKGIDTIFEGGDWDDKISHDEKSHPYIDTFKGLQNKSVPKRRIATFLNLVQGAIWEIANGYYTEDDKGTLFNLLCELESEAIAIYYTNWKVYPSFRISVKYQMYSRSELMKVGYVQTIKVPLREYRAMQYLLSSSIKPLTAAQKEALIDERTRKFFRVE